MKLENHESIAAEEILGGPQDLQFTSFDIHQQSVEWTARAMEIRKLVGETQINGSAKMVRDAG
jgi:hypothetical protein